MADFSIGVMSDSFRLPAREGIRKAKEVGADGIQVYAVRGEVCPESMDAPARKDFRRFVEELGLEISALCGDLGHYGFQHADAKARELVDRTKRIVDLASDLGTSVVTTHIGIVPAERSSPVRRIMREVCREVGRYAEKQHITCAVETGPEKAAVLCDFLDEVGSPGIGVNLDPANLVMVVADDPVAAVRTLGKYIVHTHAKDGVQVCPHDPREVYGLMPDDPPDAVLKREGELYRELPLGQGGVDWDAYLSTLREIGFSGYLTIEREVGADPAADIRSAVEFLRKKIGG